MPAALGLLRLRAANSHRRAARAFNACKFREDIPEPGTLRAQPMNGVRRKLRQIAQRIFHGFAGRLRSGRPTQPVKTRGGSAARQGAFADASALGGAYGGRETVYALKSPSLRSANRFFHISRPEIRGISAETGSGGSPLTAAGLTKRHI